MHSAIDSSLSEATAAAFERPEYEDNDRPALREHVPDSVGTLLDVGCNYGGFGHALKRTRAIEVWGVEPDVKCAKVAATRLDHVIDGHFGASNPLPDGYFDLITFNDSLEHMVDPRAALELARAKLRPGGRVHCCVPNMRHIENLEHLVLTGDWRYEEHGVRDRTHLRFFTEKSLRRLFEDAGYRVIEMTGINESWWAPEHRLRRLLFRLFPRFTRDMRFVQILVIGEPC